MKTKTVHLTKVKDHPDLGRIVVLSKHLIWKDRTGAIDEVYSDGSVMVFVDASFHAIGRPGEFEFI